jgi:hypothetical protein
MIVDQNQHDGEAKRVILEKLKTIAPAFKTI